MDDDFELNPEDFPDEDEDIEEFDDYNSDEDEEDITGFFTRNLV